MLRAVMKACVIAGCLVSLPILSAAQQVVHALTGTVSSIDKAAQTVAVLQDVGGGGIFQSLSNSKTRLDFDKKIAAGTIAADAFKDNGAYVIVFYFGGSDNRTVVAFKNLGPGPFSSTVGKVQKLERSRSISVQDESGAVQTFKIGPETIAESYAGAVDGTKFQAQSGDRVRIVSAMVDGSPTALFVRNM